MRYALIALALVLLITYDRTLRTPTEMSERMSRDGIPVARIRQYIALEKLLREIECHSHRTGVSHLGQALLVSNKIKEAFPEYSWAWHTDILKRVAEPNKSWSDIPKCARKER